jgi:dihydrofolate reductase
MKKLIVFNLITLDGFFAGPKGEINWHNVDGEFDEFSVKQLNGIDLIVFGRVTYEMMADFWPTREAIKQDPVVAGKMNSLSKIVFSKSLNTVTWNNTRLVKGNFEKEIKRLKGQSGRDIAIFGSGTVVSALAGTGLIDEYRLLVNPIVLGQGKPLFKDLKHSIKLKLLSSRMFNNGNVLLTYHS